MSGRAGHGTPCPYGVEDGVFGPANDGFINHSPARYKGSRMSLTIATWNVQNFAEPSGGTSAAFVQKLKRIATTLAAVDADVIALQELLDDKVAARIATALNALTTNGTYTAVNSQPDSRHNRVAFVSRLPIVASETEALTTWQLPHGVAVMRLERAAGAIVMAPEPTLPRPPLRIRVRLADGTTVDVINAHLKSKQLRFPGGGFSTEDASLRATAALLATKRRTAETICIRARVDRLLAEGHRVVVLGDFNDEPDAATTQILCGPTRPAAGEALVDNDSSDAQRLFNLTQLIPEAERWSRKRDGQRELLDQILASQGLMPRPESPTHAPAVHVLNNIPSSVSDHALVYATFPALDVEVFDRGGGGRLHDEAVAGGGVFAH